LCDRDLVVWVAGQARVVDARDLGVALQPARYLHRSAVLVLHAQAKRLHAAQQQVARVRIDHAAKDVMHQPHL
jgi:hypothetical protein